MIEHWRTMIDVCEAKKVNPWVLLDPEKYRNQVDTRDRNKVIIAMHGKGLRICEIISVTRVKRRTVERAHNRAGI